MKTRFIWTALIVIAGLLVTAPAWAACTAWPNILQNGQTADASQVMADFNYVQGCVPAFAGGTSTATANAQLVATTTFVQTVGYQIVFTAGFTNTGATTLNVNGTGAANLLKRTASGLAALAAGDLVVGEQYSVSWDGTEYQLLTPQSTTGGGAPVNVTSLQQATMQLYLLNALNGGWAAGQYVNGSYDAYNSDTLSGVSGTTGQIYESGKYYDSPGGQVQIPQTTGTPIGDMTASGGLAAAFDGNTNQSTSAGAEEPSGNIGWVGKDWGAGNTQTITGFKV